MNFLYPIVALILILIGSNIYYHFVVNVNNQYFYAAFRNDLGTIITRSIQDFPNEFNTSAADHNANNVFHHYFSSPSALPAIVKQHLCSIRDPSGNTLMHWAAKSASVNMMRFLLEDIECDILLENSQGTTPLLWAATYTDNPTTYPEYEQNEALLKEYYEKKSDWSNTRASRLLDLKLQFNIPINENQSEIQTSVDYNDEKYRIYEHEKHQLENELPEPIFPSANQYAEITLNPMILYIYEYAANSDKKKQIDSITTQENADTSIYFNGSSKHHEQRQKHNPSLLQQIFAHQNFQGLNVVHFATQFLSLSSIKALFHIATLPTSDLPTRTVFATLFQQPTFEDRYTPLHYIPSNCVDDNDCKKFITLMVTAGCNLKVENKYKRTVEHHLSLDKFTPLLSESDEQLIISFKQAIIPGYFSQSRSNKEKAGNNNAFYQNEQPVSQKRLIPQQKEGEFFVSRKKIQ